MRTSEFLQQRELLISSLDVLLQAHSRNDNQCVQSTLQLICANPCAIQFVSDLKKSKIVSAGLEEDLMETVGSFILKQFRDPQRVWDPESLLTVVQQQLGVSSNAFFTVWDGLIARRLIVPSGSGFALYNDVSDKAKQPGDVDLTLGSN